MTATAFVSTLVAASGQRLSEEQVHSYLNHIAVQGCRIEKIVPLDRGRAADVFFTGDVAVSAEFPFDIITQPVATRRKKILLADMESTIIEQEMLDELAARIGVGTRVADITRRAMNGELDFAAALTERVSLLKGQPESLLHEAAAFMTPMPGASELVKAMKQAGGACWLVSGGFNFFVKKIAERLGFQRYFANDLKIEHGIITGEVLRPILDKNSKKALLEQACVDYGCEMDEIVAVGDGANDVPMLQACAAGGGLGVAFHAKPKVREVVANQINHGDLTTLIHAMGLHLPP